MKKSLIVVTFALFAFTVQAAEHCTAEKKQAVCDKKIITEKVDEACKILEKQGKKSLKEVKKIQFDCCGEPNYVWVQDMHPTMIMHPMKPQLDGKDLTENADPDGKKLFVEFVKSVKAKPKGDWVEYKWTKLGETEPAPKISFVKSCTAMGETEPWIVGSGTWK